MEFLLRIVLLHIWQAFLFTVAGLGLVGVRPSVKAVLPLSLGLGVLVEILRNTIFPWHAVTMLFVQGVAQKLYFRTGWAASLTAAFLGFLLLNLGEAVVALLVLPVFGYGLFEMLEDTLGFFTVAWLSQVPLIVAAFGARRLNWVLLPLEARRGERSAVR